MSDGNVVRHRAAKIDRQQANIANASRSSTFVNQRFSVERHQESTRLQYAIVDRATQFAGLARRSWPSTMILADRA
jgi:hypothetical protein